MLDSWIERFRNKDRLALSRLLTIVARGQQLSPILNALPPPESPSRVIAITGSAGVGKSTLIGKLIDTIRKHGKTVAVLACDPQSPASGGALLGDRFRMPNEPDDGIFIRSLATEGGHGAIAQHLPAMIQVLERFGFDLIVIETVGAGQGDTSVSKLADVLVLLLQPESGDDLQWEKAGLLEVADIVVIQKSDLPGAERLEAQVRETLSLSEQQPPTILRISAKNAKGIAELWKAIIDRPIRRGQRASEADDLLQAAVSLLRDRFATALAANDRRFQDLLQRRQCGAVSEVAAGEELLHQLADWNSAEPPLKSTSTEPSSATSDRPERVPSSLRP